MTMDPELALWKSQHEGLKRIARHELIFDLLYNDHQLRAAIERLHRDFHERSIRSKLK